MMWGVSALIVLAAVIPVFCFDQFRIKGVSMNPTLLDGDHVLVNKLLFGARIYKDFDFSKHEISSFRMPGIRDVQVGDVLIFNYPDPYRSGKVEFKINYVYAKRCIGRPGDTVGISNGYFYNKSVPAGEVIGEERYQRALARQRDSNLVVNKRTAFNAMTLYDGCVWTIKDFGPVYIPSSGDTVAVNPHNLKFYERAIELETGSRSVICDSSNILLENTPLKSYVFRNNYYFLCGDNVFNSDDSRYFGLMPENYIVGIATRIIFSERARCL